MENIEKFIFIITYGRSGSTLLTRILNLIKNSDIKGENYNALYFIYKTVQSIEKTKEISNEHTKSKLHAWYGSNDVNIEWYRKELINGFCKNVLNISNKIRVSGFKEIRYFEIFNNDIKELENYLNFMKSSFKNSYFVFNIRNPEEVINSAWWKKMDSNILKSKFDKFNKWAIEYTSKNNYFLVHYNKLVQKKFREEILKNLFDYLNEELLEQSKLDEVFNTKSKYNIK